MKRVLALVLATLMLLAAAGCGSKPAEEKTFTIGMECAYAPFNWTQLEKTDTAVDIGNASYADGYDVVMGKYIAEKLGRTLVVKPIAWEGLEPAVNNGEIDAIIAGMTATPERKQNVDFTTPYYESKMVVIVRKDSDLAGITDIQQLSGRKVQGQLNTIYDDVIDQIDGVDHVTPLATYPLMVVALQNGEVDALTAELPVAVGVTSSNSDLTYVEFDADKGFEADTSVSIAVKKGNTELLDAINATIARMQADGSYEALVNAFMPAEGEAAIKVPETIETSGDVIKMGTNAAFKPFEYAGTSEIVGFDISMAQNVAKDMGRKLQVEDMAFDSLLSALDTGTIDFVAAGMTATEERRQNVDFSEPYYSSKQVVIVRK